MFYETLLVGIVLAVLFVEITNVYPGGIIVPAYFALYLDRPLQVGLTLLVALVSLVCYRILSRYMILFGKRRFVLLVLLGALWAQAGFLLLPHAFPLSWEVRAIGWLIPGLLANNLEKQRWLPTLASLFTVAVMTYFVIKIFAWIGL